MKKLTSAVVASSLVFGLVGTAFANYSVESVTKAAVRMQTLGLIQGVPTPGGGLDLVLDQKLTRAQLVTVIVRAWGQSETAKLLVGAPSFPDATNHPWASGEIALAKNIAAQNGFTLGYPDGTFKPEGTVTAAEAVALTNKFLGIAPTAGLSWPMGDIQGALDAGIITADDKNTLAALPNIEANRGLAFYLADSAFRTFKLPNGKTVYTTYVDTTPPEVTVDSYTASTDKDSITLTGTAKGQSVLHVGYTGADVVTPKADGTWSANVSLKVGANDIWIHALDVAGNATEVKNVKVTRVAGAAAKVEASLSSALLKAGETADLNVKVSDATGAEIADAVVDVTVEGDIGTYDAATGKFTAATVPADGKLVITSGTVSTEVTAMVVAGDLAKIVISPATVDLQSGTSQKFTVAGEDAHGNTVAVGAATWTASKGVIGADGTFGATSDSTGTVTVTATVGDMSGTATASVFGSAAKVQVAAPEAIVSNSKSETTVTATVLDANGNVARTYNGTVTFASSNTAAATVKTASVTAVNGVASTTIVAGNTAGTTVLSASAAGLTGTTATYTTTAQVATSVAASVSSNSMAAATGSETTVTLTLKDQLGEKMLAAPAAPNQITVRLTSSDSTVAFFGTNSATADVVMNAVEVDTALKGTSKVGGVTVTGVVTAPTSSTVSVGSVSVNTLVVGSAYQIKVDEITAAKKAGEAVTVTFRVLDFNGNQLTTSPAGDSAGLKVERITSAGVATDLTALPGALAASATKGVGTYSVTTTATGTFTIKVSGNSLVAGTTSLTVNPGVATGVTLTASPDTLSANGAAQTTLKATITDANGNKVTDGSYSVTFKRTPGGTAGLTLADTTVATVNGEASVTLTAGTATGVDTFTVTATGLTSATETVTTAVQGAANNLNVDTIANIAAGAEASVPVQIRDAANNVVTSDNGRTVTVTIKDDTTVVATATGTTVNGVATVKVPGITKAKALPGLTVEAESTGLTKATNGTLVVAPAAATKIVVTTDRAALSANTASKATLTVTQYDQYDNKVNNNANAVDVYLQVTSGGAYGSLQGAANGTGDWVGWHKVTISALNASAKTVDGGLTPNSLVATTAAGTVVVTARSGSLTESVLSISTVVTGQAAALNVSAAADTAASIDDANAKYQEITVTLVDGNGSAITHDSVSTVTLADPTVGVTDVVKVKDAAGVWQAYTYGNAATLIKGQLTFGVINSKAETMTYSFTTVVDGTIGGTAPVKTATGKFVAGAATSVAVDASTPARITGDGIGLTTVSARVTDTHGNTVTSAGGTMTFAISTGNDYATLQALTAPIVNGVASIVAQSKVLPGGIEQSVIVKASSDLNADGSITGTEEHIPGGATFTVDTVKPTVNSVVATGYAATNTITITFSEAMTQSTLSAASLSVVSNNSFGGAGAKVEFTGATTLVITLGAGPTVVAGDVIKAVSATTLTDVAGNGFGTDTLVTTPAP